MTEKYFRDARVFDYYVAPWGEALDAVTAPCLNSEFKDNRHAWVVDTPRVPFVIESMRPTFVVKTCRCGLVATFADDDHDTLVSAAWARIATVARVGL